MKRRGAIFGIIGIILTLAILAIAVTVLAETLTWTNPTSGIDNTGVTVPLTTAEQGALKNYLWYRVPPATTWTYFAETAGGKTTWVGTLPSAPGVPAVYTVSAALLGADGIERDSAKDPVPVTYTVPFPPGRTPGNPSGTKITRP